MQKPENRRSAVDKIRDEYMHIKSNIVRFVDTRMRLGLTHSQAIVELINQAKNRHCYVFRYASSPGNTPVRSVPSIATIKNAIREIYNSPDLLESAGLGTPHSPGPRDFQRGARTNLGNAVRNLGPLFSGEQSSFNEENRRSWRNESLNRIRMLREHLDRRTSTARGEALVGVNTGSKTKTRKEAEDRDRSEAQVQPKTADDLHDAAIPAYQYDPLTFNPNELTFTQCVNVMNSFDFDKHYEMIRATLPKFSIKIYGMDPCDSRDLQLAVYFFIERQFFYMPKIEMCVRPIEDINKENVVGVLFEKIEAVEHIIKNRAALDYSQFLVARNYDPKWIIMNYKNDDD